MIIYEREIQRLVIPTGEGNESTYKPCSQAIAEAYQSGWTGGYEQGLEDCPICDCSSAITEAYSSGWSAGYSSGITTDCGEAIEQAFEDGFASGSTRSANFVIPTTEIVGSYRPIYERYLNGKPFTSRVDTDTIRKIKFYGETTESAVTSLSFIMQVYTDLKSGITINGAEVAAESISIVQIEDGEWAGWYQYTITFDEAQIYDGDSYAAGYDNGYEIGWDDGWTSAKTQSLRIGIKTVSVIGSVQIINSIKLNGKDTDFSYNTAVMKTISIYGNTAESAVTSLSFNMAIYTELVDGFAINGIYYDAESVTIEDLGGGLYNYTIAFDEVPIYEGNSYKAGFDQGYISGTNRQANIQLDYDIYSHSIRCRQLKVNDEYMRVDYYADNATIIGYTNITPITKIEMEITAPLWGIDRPETINGMTINGLPATIESQSSVFLQNDGVWDWFKYTFNISSFVFTEYNEGYQAGLAACQGNQ